MQRLFISTVLIVFLVLSVVVSAFAQSQGLSIIRDQETEDALYSYTRPMFVAGSLSPDTLQIYLVKDSSINAFTTKGSIIFVNTGLITSADSVGEVIGVLAHETGHIAGGHLARLYDNMKIAQRNALISTILGGVAGIATGRPDVGMAVMMGGEHASMMGHLAYRQGEENAADAIATKILDRTKYSSKGFLKMMGRLAKQEKIALSQDYYSYLRTHPLSEERVKFLTNRVMTERYKDDSAHPEAEQSFQRIKAKLVAFLIEPYRTLLLYDKAKSSLAARYARAIAYYRMGDLDKALALMDELIKENPADPYFYELKGQMLFEHGRVAEALAPYEKAVSLAPKATLIATSYAGVLIETGKTDAAKKAVKLLEKVLLTERDEPDVWRLLASAANLTGDEALTAFAMAEYNFLIGNIEGAKVQIKRAEQLIPKKSAKYLALMDLKAELESLGD